MKIGKQRIDGAELIAWRDGHVRGLPTRRKMAVFHDVCLERSRGRRPDGNDQPVVIFSPIENGRGLRVYLIRLLRNRMIRHIRNADGLKRTVSNMKSDLGDYYARIA